MPSTDTRQLQLQISASAELMIRNLKKADAGLADFQQQTERRLAAVDNRMERVGEGFNPGRLTSLLGGASVVGIAGGFLALADQAKSMRAQITLATQDFGSFGQAQADVERIAAVTRVGLEATTSLYGNFIRAAQPLGRTQADAATATESFSKALKIGGADATVAAQATLQFSQALASGVLRGDEFNSIAEASPRILKLLADAMGVPQGQLRALAAQGKLTADKLYDALTNTRVTAGLNAEFAQLPVTMGDALQLVKDSATELAGAFDEGSGLSTAIAGLVSRGSGGAGTMADAWFSAGAELRGEFVGIAGVWADAMDRMEAAAGVGTGGIVDQFETMRQSILMKILQARDSTEGLLSLVDKIANVSLGAQRLAARGFNGLFASMTDETPLSVPLARWSNYAANYANRRDSVIGAREAQRQEPRLKNLARQAGQLSIGADGHAVITYSTPPRAVPTPAPGSGHKLKPATPKKSPAAPTFAIRPGLTRGQMGITGRNTFDDIYDHPDFDEGLRSANQQVQASVQETIAARDELLRKNPLLQFRQQLHENTDDMNAALQGVAVNGMQTLENSLLRVIDGTESLGEAFTETAKSIIADLARIAIEKAIVGALGQGFFGVKLADGGEVKKLAGGGPVWGAGGPRTDSIPAMLSNGEFVLNAATTAAYRPMIEAMHAGRLRRFSDGGAVGPSFAVPAIPSFAGMARGGGGGPAVVRVHLSDDLHATIQQHAAGVAVEVVRGAAPSIVDAGVTATIARLRTPTL